MSVIKINSKRETPQMLCIIKMSDQLPKVATLEGVVPVCVYIHICLLQKNPSLYLLSHLIYLIYLNNRELGGISSQSYITTTFLHISSLRLYDPDSPRQICKLCKMCLATSHSFGTSLYFSIYSLLPSLKNAKSSLSFSSLTQNPQAQGPTMSYPFWVLLSCATKSSLSSAI